jgi:hypothetical protein
LKVAVIVIWTWVLIIGSACAQEKRGTVIHKRPIEGMQGYKIIIREAQGVEKRVYQVEDTGTQEPNGEETLPPLVESLEGRAEPPSADGEPVAHPLRRQRIPLRRNRNLLLKQQSESNN